MFRMLAARPLPPRAGVLTALMVLSVATTALGAALAIGPDGPETGLVLTMGQTFGVGWLFVYGWNRTRLWATATTITAAGWVAIFLAPCWIYAVNPTLLEYGSPNKAIAAIDLSFFALLAGMVALRGPDAHEESPTIAVQSIGISRQRAVVWVAIALLAISVLFASSGGPLQYLTNLDETTGMTAGLTYVVLVVLAIKAVALTVICDRWTKGERIGRPMASFFIIALTIIGLLGARAFLAFALCELLLSYALLRRAFSGRIVIPATIVVALLLVFGYGTVKRYQTYKSTSADSAISFPRYVEDKAVDELVTAYANNYADGVRLTALAVGLVPERAGHEYGKAIVRFALQPIPRPFRPKVSTDPVIEETFEPNLPGGNNYAIPLQVVSYLQLGLPAVILAFALAGAGVSALEARARRPTSSLSSFMLLVAAIVQVPFVLRTGIPRGLSVSLFYLVIVWCVARTIQPGPLPLPRTRRRWRPTGGQSSS